MRRLFLIIFLVVLVIGALLGFYRRERTVENDGLTLYGNVDVRLVDLGFRVGGRVTEMFHEEGDLVQEGDLLGCIEKEPYGDLVLEAEASLSGIHESLQNAQSVLKRRVGLVGEGGVSQEDFDNSKTNRDVLVSNLLQAEASLAVAKKNLHDTRVFAPTEGTILTRIREPGSVVREGDPIYTLSILSPIWVRAFVSEPQLGAVYPGMRAEIYTDTPGGTIYKGYVGFISPIAEFTPKTVETKELRTDLVYRLRIYAENPDHGLKQGMPVTVKLYYSQETAH